MEHTSDILVIGSGLAGLGYALKVAEFARVNLMTKKGLTETSTSKAQGGIAAVLGPDDRFEYHIQDTLTTGEGLSHPDIVELVVRQGPARIRELIDMGAHFDMGKDNGYDLGREGGHSHRRVIHAQDMTGAEVERILSEKVLAHPNIRVFENHMGVDLITRQRLVRRGAVVANAEESCLGAYVLNTLTGEVDTFTAAITLLATGGVGKVYLYTSNPDIATGDGIAMAYRAGAWIGNMEFVQFHPTCLYHPAAKNFLISEALRGEGAILIDRAGQAFMEKYHPLKDLAPRDTVARAIDLEMKKSGADCVYLDISHKPADFVKSRFPNIYQECLKYGIDHHPRAHPGGARGPLHVRRGGDGRLGPDQHLQPLRGGGSVHDRPPRRQPPGQQLAPGGPGLFAPGGPGGQRDAARSPGQTQRRRCRSGTRSGPPTAKRPWWCPTTGTKSAASCGTTWASSAPTGGCSGPSTGST